MGAVYLTDLGYAPRRACMRLVPLRDEGWRGDRGSNRD